MTFTFWTITLTHMCYGNLNVFVGRSKDAQLFVAVTQL